MRLGVNIDHVATLRQARYRQMPGVAQEEPDIVELAGEAIAGGGHGITMHLRADRRHVQDRDIERVAREIDAPLNFEMGVTAEILEIAVRILPATACLVPEEREEVTTEGGLDVAGGGAGLEGAIGRLRGVGIGVSLFIDPDEGQVRAAAGSGAEMIELHTGRFANAAAGSVERRGEVERLVRAADLAHGLGLRVNAGHGLTCGNLPELFAVPHVEELNVGHHLISRAMVVGLRAAVREFREVMELWAGGGHGA